MKRFRWAAFILGSIALHLLGLYFLGSGSTKSSTGLVYLDEIKLSGSLGNQNSNVNSTTQHKSLTSSVKSSAPQAGSQTLSSNPDYGIQRALLVKVRDALMKKLNESLDGSIKGQLTLELDFKDDGSLQSQSISKSSGVKSLDAEALKVLSEVSVEKSKELANLKVQIPVEIF